MNRGIRAGRFHKIIKAKFKMIPAVYQAFKKLKEAFISPPILTYFNPDKLILLVTNASGFAYIIILLQPFGNNPLP